MSLSTAQQNKNSRLTPQVKASTPQNKRHASKHSTAKYQRMTKTNIALPNVSCNVPLCLPSKAKNKNKNCFQLWHDGL